MNYFFSFGLIWLMLELGNLLSRLIQPLVLIPGSLLGMLLLFLLLSFRVIKLAWIEPLTNFFLKHMSFFFIPLGVGVLGSIQVLKPIWIQMTILLVISNLVVLLVTGWSVQGLIRREQVKR